MNGYIEIFKALSNENGLCIIRLLIKVDSELCGCLEKNLNIMFRGSLRF